MRKFRGNMQGERFPGIKETGEVHSTDNENPLSCLDEIKDKGNDVPIKLSNESKKSGFTHFHYYTENLLKTLSN